MKRETDVSSCVYRDCWGWGEGLAGGGDGDGDGNGVECGRGDWWCGYGCGDGGGDAPPEMLAGRGEQ